MKNRMPLWREAHFQVKIYKTPQCPIAFGSCDVEKVYADVVRSTFPSQNAQCTKHTTFSALLEVAMLKKWTPVRREAQFQVKSVKNCGVLTTFGRSDVVLSGRRYRLCSFSKVSKTWNPAAILPKTNSTPLHCTTRQLPLRLQLQVQMQPQLHYITLN